MEKKDLKPGYFNQLPIIDAIGELKQTIGLQDSYIQTNQIAFLYLKEQSESTEDKELFLAELFKKYSISRGTFDFEYFQSIQYRSYILQTYNLIEPFFKNLNSRFRFYNNFIGDWKVKKGDKNLDPFNQLLENLETGKAKKIISFPEYHLIDYYRIIRNAFVHLQETDDEHKKTTKYYKEKIVPHLQHFKENYELDAPNKPEQINFEDFMLYTRAIKYFSNILNDVCFPDLTDFVEVAKEDETLQKSLQQSRNLNYQGALLKRVNVLRSFFHGHFSIHHKDLRDEFCRLYLTDEGTPYKDVL